MVRLNLTLTIPTYINIIPDIFPDAPLHIFKLLRINVSVLYNQEYMWTEHEASKNRDLITLFPQKGISKVDGKRRNGRLDTFQYQGKPLQEVIRVGSISRWRYWDVQ